MIISISSFIEDQEKRETLNYYFNIRETALNIAYSIPGYREAKLDTKNYIYDAIKNSLEKL